MKEVCRPLAERKFEDVNINITTAGRQRLKVFVVDEKFCKEHNKYKVAGWKGVL